jgi:dTMP kinase
VVITFVVKEISQNMKLLVIEGVDGAGKSTQINLLRDFFSANGHNCEYLHFPRTDSPYFGELIARFLRGEFGNIGEVNPYLVAMLYAGDRKDASEMIQTWLNGGKVVLIDRYTYSNIAYQCAKLKEITEQERLMQWILALEFEHFAIPRPDLNLFLDVPFTFTRKKLSGTRSGEDRNYLNGTRDIHEESLDFQKKVRELYLKVSGSDDRLEAVNCSTPEESMLPPDKIFERIVAILEKRKFL